MSQHSISLDRQILTAFKLAQEIGRPVVAEHLLCALECLCEEDCAPGALGDAYRAICSCRPIRPWRQRQ